MSSKLRLANHQSSESLRVNTTLPVTLIRTIRRSTLISRTINTGFLRLIPLILKNPLNHQRQSTCVTKTHITSFNARRTPSQTAILLRPEFYSGLLQAKISEDTVYRTMSIPMF